MFQQVYVDRAVEAYKQYKLDLTEFYVWYTTCKHTSLAACACSIYVFGRMYFTVVRFHFKGNTSFNMCCRNGSSVVLHSHVTRVFISIIILHYVSYTCMYNDEALLVYVYVVTSMYTALAHHICASFRCLLYCTGGPSGA